MSRMGGGGSQSPVNPKCFLRFASPKWLGILSFIEAIGLRAKKQFKGQGGSKMPQDMQFRDHHRFGIWDNLGSLRTPYAITNKRSTSNVGYTVKESDLPPRIRPINRDNTMKNKNNANYGKHTFLLTSCFM